MPGREKGFSSQIKKMSKKPLKYSPEVVTVVKVDMAQDMFDFAIDTVVERLLNSVFENSRQKMSQVWPNIVWTSSTPSLESTGCQL